MFAGAMFCTTGIEGVFLGVIAVWNIIPGQLEN
jgi:hypothetical protein